ncbi:His/Gly/Thr/Pro-type tRNA ligase C-terminal domain-containing protein [Sulfitobacter dubius]|uniref:His/Gly/Thr/Pro-type tRNA ligase C-terminal domain-containing protein n=1 Tax=Sulfitobacter dubius TaxID=218673 RepID=UPI0008EC95C6|nr:His/Gly/Thr/Pro-type tRNA ligase C-terminal domain-containing protein [Sulfitobacter dubius]SFH14416.1 Anticodon binding domain-containing protein [Sulfitobacter dubius]
MIHIRLPDGATRALDPKSTLQVDFNLPERFGTTYVAASGDRLAPVMLHRALFGSLERLTGILIEHHAGHLPLWLAPVQAVVATVTGAADGWAREVTAALQAAGLRVESDLRNEKIGYKVREHALQKIPLQIALGAREAEASSVTMRRHGSDKTETITLDEAVLALVSESQRPGTAD